jgi:hypothetical protein
VDVVVELGERFKKLVSFGDLGMEVGLGLVLYVGGEGVGEIGLPLGYTTATNG